MKIDPEKFMQVIIMILFSCITSIVVTGTVAALIQIFKFIF